MEKARIYESARADLAAILEGEDDPIARMSTISSVLKEKLPWASWVGFYRVTEPGLLVVGPYQGGIGCLRIPFTRGVCGAAARTGTTQVIPDVHAFPGHIACDAGARSEIVLPVRDHRGEIVAVLDIDSREPAAFDEEDRRQLEMLIGSLLTP
jgi:GAF domain-containing protein